MFNAMQIASMEARHAPATDIALARFHEHALLLDLNRIDDALDLLNWCLEVFKDAQDLRMLGNVFGSLAAAEELRGNAGAALHLEYDALRYSYRAGDVTGIAVSYQNLGNRFRKESSQPTQALAFHLAAAVIRTLTSAEGSSRSVSDAAEDLRQFGPRAVPPTGIEDLSAKIGSIPGTNPAALIARLSPGPEMAERTLQVLVTKARNHTASGNHPVHLTRRRGALIPHIGCLQSSGRRQATTGEWPGKEISCSGRGRLNTGG